MRRRSNSCQVCNKYCDKLELYDDENLSGRFYWICNECKKRKVSSDMKANLVLIFIVLMFISILYFIRLFYDE